MKRLFASILAPLFFSIHAFGWGGEVGNGGDVIECSARPTGEPAGLYTLDYLLAPPRLARSAHSLEKIQSNLLNLHPPLGRSLKKFVRLIENTDTTEIYIWSPNPFGLIDIEDEAVVANLPPECGSGPTKKWQQAVIQQEVGQKRLLNYDSNLIARLRQDPAQYSYLIVHEWLWSIAKSATQVRLANQVFHNDLAGDTETMTSLMLVETLNALGLQIPTIEAGDRQTLMYELRNGYELDFFPRDLKFMIPLASSSKVFFIEFKNIGADTLTVASIGRTRDPSPITVAPGSAALKQVDASSKFMIINQSRPWISPSVRKVICVP